MWPITSHLTCIPCLVQHTSSRRRRTQIRCELRSINWLVSRQTIVKLPKEHWWVKCPHIVRHKLRSILKHMQCAIYIALESLNVCQFPGFQRFVIQLHRLLATHVEFQIVKYLSKFGQNPPPLRSLVFLHRVYWRFNFFENIWQLFRDFANFNMQRIFIDIVLCLFLVNTSVVTLSVLKLRRVCKSWVAHEIVLLGSLFWKVQKLHVVVALFKVDKVMQHIFNSAFQVFYFLFISVLCQRLVRECANPAIHCSPRNLVRAVAVVASRHESNIVRWWQH